MYFYMCFSKMSFIVYVLQGVPHVAACVKQKKTWLAVQSGILSSGRLTAVSRARPPHTVYIYVVWEVKNCMDGSIIISFYQIIMLLSKQFFSSHMRRWKPFFYNSFLEWRPKFLNFPLALRVHAITKTRGRRYRILILPPIPPCTLDLRVKRPQ